MHGESNARPVNGGNHPFRFLPWRASHGTIVVIPYQGKNEFAVFPGLGGKGGKQRQDQNGPEPRDLAFPGNRLRMPPVAIAEHQAPPECQLRFSTSLPPWITAQAKGWRRLKAFMMATELNSDDLIKDPAATRH